MDVYRNQLASYDNEVAAAIEGEERRQVDGVEMIPSENYTYPEVLAALGSVLTNKYSEGYPGRRYYGGQQYTDVIERLACERACQAFHAEHANVQPLSGSPMNQAVYFGLLNPGDTVLAMDLSHGGHLTHGSPLSHMGRIFRFVRYKTRGAKGDIDLDAVRALAHEHRPKLILCGHSSYPREIDYAAFKSIADEIGAITMADISHIGGLVAAGATRNPIDAGFDIVTTTTHKTLRGPRGGLILCRKQHAKTIDAAVFPGLQGGPHMNNIAGAAITFKKALEPSFRDYGMQILRNARSLADALVTLGVVLVTGGTDNHLLVIDTISGFNLDGKAAEETLDRVGITTNKQVIPDDPRPPLRPSGIRLGTPACTTRGMREPHMEQLAQWMVEALRQSDNANEIERIRSEVRSLCRQFSVPGIAQVSA